MKHEDVPGIKINGIKNTMFINEHITGDNKLLKQRTWQKTRSVNSSG